MKETFENLAKAFIGESQARNRYTFYSKVARKEGFQQISWLFLLTADNEKEHASWLMKMMQQLKEKCNENLDQIEVPGAVPTILGTTAENLKAAIGGEHYENSIMYPSFADGADGDGLPDIAKRLRAIGKVETHHEERYTKLLNQVEAGTVFKKDKEVAWLCRECGYVHFGTEPPEKCPSCDHDREYYEILCETF